MHRFAIMFVGLAAYASAHAEIYECVDQNGNKRFTNIAAEAKGCKVLNVGPIAPPSSAPAGAAPASKAKAAPRTPSSHANGSLESTSSSLARP